MKPDFSTRPGTRQSGYALILMVLALIGVGGVVIASFTQGVKLESEHERYLHNQRVLLEAKQALLQYAYNYPQMGSNPIPKGPGRLPCPDADNDGDPDTAGNSCILVGRFPWADPNMNFYEAKDAAGERLWYAVSKKFHYFTSAPAVKINSDTEGSITVRDRSNAILYDGGTAGVAAVIIAPGAPIARNGVTQVRGSAAEKVDPVNYLDLLAGVEDNADFVNSDPNGFVTGPIIDVVTGDLLVNDQMIVVTAAEVIAMAEMATLQAYRDAIRNYLDRTGDVYPWLYNYAGVTSVDALSSYFPAIIPFDDPASLGNDFIDDELNDHLFSRGRIPTLFGEYFTETGTEPIESRLTNSSLSLIDPATSDTYTLTETYCKSGCPGESAGVYNFYHDPVDGGPTITFETAQALTNVEFIDTDPDVVGNDGRLSVTFPTPETIGPFHMYFYDNDHSPVAGYWTACPAGADALLDCSRDSSGNPTPGAANNFKSRILHLTVTLSFNGTGNFDFDYGPGAPATSVTAASATSHATITGTYAAANIISFPGTLSATYEYIRHWHEGDPAIDINDPTYTKGNVDMTGFSLASLALGIRYYPEIPHWALDNNWHNAVYMAYAEPYRPDNPPAPCAGTACLSVPDAPGAPQDKISLLILAGQHDWNDSDSDLSNDLGDVFDPSNFNYPSKSFYRHKGNDKLLVIEEL